VFQYSSVNRTTSYLLRASLRAHLTPIARATYSRKLQISANNLAFKLATSKTKTENLTTAPRISTKTKYKIVLEE
jgi:hypothetical protein